MATIPNYKFLLKKYQNKFFQDPFFVMRNIIANELFAKVLIIFIKTLFIYYLFTLILLVWYIFTNDQVVLTFLSSLFCDTTVSMQFIICYAMTMFLGFRCHDYRFKG
jgi:hypothetical protein